MFISNLRLGKIGIMYKINEIGVVRNELTRPEGAFKLRNQISTILLHEQYENGLFKIEENEYLQILFYFHESNPNSMKLDGLDYKGGLKGVFASRAPNRPSLIGLTTVKLIERKGRELKVWGLDAINGTPILDIKPLAIDIDTYRDNSSEENIEFLSKLEVIKCQN